MTAIFTRLAKTAMAYVPPSWCSLTPPPHGRLRLAHLPTPVYPLWMPSDETPISTAPPPRLFATLQQHQIALWIKRDDCTGGLELSGNKIRKLEFLLADALAQKCNTVVTIGGEQSNHCRATAAAARMVGLEPHLILRRSVARPYQHNNNKPEADDDDDLGTVGNLLVDRMVGSHIYTCTPGEYGRIGSEAMVQRLCAHLQQEKPDRKIYPIPVGGSNAIGTWGYLEAVNELIQQLGEKKTNMPQHVVFACGSGGTAAGIVLGFCLAYGEAMPQLHAVGVCDDPDYFYAYMAGIVSDMGFQEAGFDSVEDYLRQHVTLHQGKGRGYAQSTPEELNFVVDLARHTGVLLDPVYSGKALHHFCTEVIDKDPTTFANQSVLFWHTGGSLGLFDKVEEMMDSTSLINSSPCQRLDVYGKGNGIDISK